MAGQSNVQGKQKIFGFVWDKLPTDLAQTITDIKTEDHCRMDY